MLKNILFFKKQAYFLGYFGMLKFVRDFYTIILIISFYLNRFLKYFIFKCSFTLERSGAERSKEHNIANCSYHQAAA